MAKPRRTYKLLWRSKRANHGRKGACGKIKSRLSRFSTRARKQQYYK